MDQTQVKNKVRNKIQFNQKIVPIQFWADDSSVAFQ